MPCGETQVKVTADCKNLDKTSMEKICKDYKIEMRNIDEIKTFKLPYIPRNQIELLKKQGFTFNSEVRKGDWAPSTIRCLESNYLLIGYQLGLTEEENINGSLLSYIKAPFFTTSGHFITGDKEINLRKTVINNPYIGTPIDFITPLEVSND